MTKQPKPVFLVFTRNWIDPEGEGHGFKFVTATGFECYAQERADRLNSHQIAGTSRWEWAAIPPETVMELANG